VIRYHRVRPGDRLSTIAGQYGLDTADLLEANLDKRRTRTLGGAEVFADLAVGEDLVLPAFVGADPNAIGDYLPPGATCPAGSVYSAATGTCLDSTGMAPNGSWSPSCPVGYFDPATKTCPATPGTPSGDPLPANASCPDGTHYVAYTRKCLDPSGGPAVDPSCLQMPTGGPGQFAWDAASESCVLYGNTALPAGAFCPSGFFYTADGLCHDTTGLQQMPQCAGMNWDPQAMQCAPVGQASSGDPLPAFASCPQGSAFHAAAGHCVTGGGFDGGMPTCSSNLMWNPASMACEDTNGPITAIVQAPPPAGAACPAGTDYFTDGYCHDLKGQNASHQPSCGAGSTWNAWTKSCLKDGAPLPDKPILTPVTPTPDKAAEDEKPSIAPYLWGAGLLLVAGGILYATLQISPPSKAAPKPRLA
jgi:hypothetical protein